jgi:cation:H+ antiporter
VLDFALLVGSLALLLLAARYFVDGISSIAAGLGVPPLVIGMTVVAFGTSTPELVVNALSATQGSTSLAFGNIAGSCIVNIGFVLGVTALIQPLRVEPSLITREIPMMIVGVLAVLIFANDRFLDAAAENVWTRTDALVLLLLFGIFLYYTTRQAIAAPKSDAFIEEVREESKSLSKRDLGKQSVLAVLGLIGVSLGANWTVEYAVNLARLIGLSEAVIGLTVISLGTTLPELATCVLAARRGNPDIALGNVVGSNIFNLLCVAGIVGTIRPVPIPSGGIEDLLLLSFLAIILLPIAIRSLRSITRGEAAFLLLTLIAYLTWRISSATA